LLVVFSLVSVPGVRFIQPVHAKLATSRISYAGYSVVEVKPRQSADVIWLEKSSGCRLLAEWTSSGAGFLCSRSQAATLRTAAKSRDLVSRYSTRHLGRQIAEEQRNDRTDKTDRIDRIDRIDRGGKQARGRGKDRTAGTAHKRKARRRITHLDYVGVNEIYRFLNYLSEKHRSVGVSSIGRSVQGRPIKLVTVNGGKNLTRIFVDSGIHAREWISPAATLVFIERLAKALTRSGRRSMWREFEWNIIPMANPDGYEYSRTKDRMWRKNLSKNPGSTCVGVDLNRNFPEGYGVGASNQPCSEVFKGAAPLTEPESRAIDNYIRNTKNIRAAVSVHSYGNVLIFPWGYKEEPHPRKAQLRQMANMISADVKQRTGEIYRPGTSKEVFGAWGLAGGATDDYYITKNVPYSFTFELPQKDKAGGKNHGFLIPPSNIKPVGQQLFIGLQSLASNLQKLAG